ncbi:DUF4150 domain-containing protein [Roseateles chitosanitabidus]|uniref:DUF4150 domain-containing protein n=1 Tax=Roseateles chitosanitabidus TaxID=65048 RepID=UPI00083632D1|nr:DUF4150 domain-containing protein [Roseateles chitosanitabidus]MBO9685063.1 DUF4150 domain-containing protein [Roseateles chitosanitabidus]
MSRKVYANGREISAKKDDNKAICSMPDVCLSPPGPPAGPIPIPYPNTAQASDTDGGSRSVKIGGGEVGLKNVSTYKKSTGDEAATKSFGMSVISHNIQGPLKHAAWSMDVRIEGQNVIRHMDMTTQNHSNPGSVPGIDIASMAAPGGDPECVELEKMARQAVTDDFVGKEIPGNVALVNSKTSGGAFYKAVQPDNAQIIHSGKAAGYAKPHGEASHPCDGKAHNSNSQGNRDHCECKILHKASAEGMSGGGSITMRINWNTDGALSDSPCGACMGSLCDAAANCDVEIYLCNGPPDNMKKQKAPCHTVNHKDGSQSHKWQSKRWTKHK